MARTIIRLRINHKLQLDDFFLFFACACCAACMGIVCAEIPDIYFFQDMVRNMAMAVEVPISELLHKVERFTKMDQAYLVLSWLAIFTVKLSFLFFFRRLADRIHNVIHYWRVVTVFTVIAGLFNACEIFIACPKTGIESG